jgi:hypothetical protein
VLEAIAVHSSCWQFQANFPLKDLGSGAIEAYVAKMFEVVDVHSSRGRLLSKLSR